MRLYEITKVELTTDPHNFGANIRSGGRDKERTVMLPVRKLTTNEPLLKTKKGIASSESEDNVQNLMMAIKRGENIPPILVRKHKLSYQVVDGHHRLEAFRRLRIPKIPATIIPPHHISYT